MKISEAARTAARPQPAWGAVTLTLSLENLTGWSILQPLAIPMGGVKPLLEVPVDKWSLLYISAS